VSNSGRGRTAPIVSGQDPVSPSVTPTLDMVGAGQLGKHGSIAAERQGRVHQIGCVIRGKIAEQVLAAPADARILLNLHPTDLVDEELYRAEAPRTAFASRVILEVTERAPLDGVADRRTRIRKLRKLEFRIALDDLGAGYAGLTTFTKLEPDIVKLDMVFARGIEIDFTKQHLVKSMLAMCSQLHVKVIAEGIERSMFEYLGCDLIQGYLFARRERDFPVPVHT